MRRTSMIAVLMATTILLWPGTAPGQVSQNPYLRTAIDHYDSLRYQDALKTLEYALSYPGNGRQDMVSIYRYLGMIHGALGNAESAKAAFMKLLALDATAVLARGLSPRITGPFEEAKSWWKDRAGLRIDFDSPAFVKVGAPLTLTVYVTSDPLGMVAGARARYSFPGDASPSEVRTTGKSPLNLTIPATLLGEKRCGQTMEYFIEVFEENGGVLISLGQQDFRR